MEGQQKTLLLIFKAATLQARRGPGLTLRSTGAPTAGHLGPAGGTRYIFTGRAKASCRRRPVTSNVRPRKIPLYSSITAMLSFGTKRAHTRRYQSDVGRSPEQSKATPNQNRWQMIIGGQPQSIRGMSASMPGKGTCIALFTRQWPTNETKIKPHRFNKAHASMQRGQFMEIGSRLSRQALRPHGWHHGYPKIRIPYKHSYSPRAPAWPNPSFNRTHHGRSAWPGRRYAVHFRQPGQAALPRCAS